MSDQQTDFETKVRVRFMPDHVPGNFEWETPPTCCDSLKEFFKEKAGFVSNIADYDSNHVYMLPITAEGELLSTKGVVIGYCPFCGTKIQVTKRYESAENATEGTPKGEPGDAA